MRCLKVFLRYLFFVRLEFFYDHQDTDLIYFGRKKFVEKEKRYNKQLMKPEFSYWTIGYYITYSGALKLTQSNYLSYLKMIELKNYLYFDFLLKNVEILRR